jgi:opacity protein-like surface antigen
MRAPKLNLSMNLTMVLGAMAIAALGVMTPTPAQAQASSSSSSSSQGAATRVRVTLLKTPLRETCSETGKVKGSVSEGDELEVVSRDGAWYRVRLPGSGGAEGCVAARAVEPADGSPRRGPATAAPSSQRGGPSTPARTTTAPRKSIGVSGFVDFGSTSFTASDSFEAILDTSSGPIFGGGGQVNLPLNLFARVDVTRFKKDGERAFVNNGEVVKLGIPTTIEVMPIEFTGGYRRELTFGRRGAKPGARPSEGFRIIPFAGGGVGVVQYKETADFAQAGDDVDESFTSYHFIGGVEVPLWKFIGVGAEYHHRWVPDALGTGGVSAEFNETDLGGGTFRFRVIFGF